MKKIVIFTLICFALVGCSKDDTKTMKCSFYQNDVVNKYEITSTYEITYSGKFVDSVTTTEEVKSEDESILETFEDNLNTTYSAFQENYDGYTVNVTNKDGIVKSVVSIDYDKMDLEKYVKDVPAMNSYIVDGKITLDGIVSLYESIGASCEN